MQRERFFHLRFDKRRQLTCSEEANASHYRPLTALAPHKRKNYTGVHEEEEWSSAVPCSYCGAVNVAPTMPVNFCAHLSYLLRKTNAPGNYANRHAHARKFCACLFVGFWISVIFSCTGLSFAEAHLSSQAQSRMHPLHRRKRHAETHAVNKCLQNLFKVQPSSIHPSIF